MIYNFEFVKKNNITSLIGEEFNEQELVEKLADDSVENKELQSAVMNILSGLRNQIAEHCRLEKICFLFGNGTSIYAGSKSIDDDNFDYDKTLEDELLQLKDLFRGKSKEEQLNILLTFKKYFELTCNKNISIVSEIISKIKNDLLNNYVNSIDYNKLIYHEILIRKLRNINSLNKVKLFTTNYDLAFECSLDKLSIDYLNGFTGFVNRKFNIRSFQENGKIKLYKVHGSINRKYENNDIVEKQPLIINGKLKDETCNNDIMIFPTSNKIEETFNAPYSELMREMLNILDTGSNVLFVLGYRYKDDHINDILFKSLNNPNNIYYFFDYDNNDNNEFINKMIRLSESLSNIYILRGKFFGDFSIFCNYIFPSSSRIENDESIIDLLKKIKDNE